LKLTARVDGLGDLGARLSRLADQRALATELRKTAEEVRERAAANLAESGSSGRLAESLTVTPDGDGGFVVGTALDHGWHREFGSHLRGAKPWLAPAVEAARPGLIARVAARLRRAGPKE
jgi:hypothetical protein